MRDCPGLLQIGAIPRYTVAASEMTAILDPRTFSSSRLGDGYYPGTRFSYRSRRLRRLTSWNHIPPPKKASEAAAILTYPAKPAARATRVGEICVPLILCNKQLSPCQVALHDDRRKHAELQEIPTVSSFRALPGCFGYD